MRCPSCQAPFNAPLEQCPACGMNLEQLDIKFGALPRYLYPLTDHTGKLPDKEFKETVTLLRLFHRKFPQSLFAAFLIDGLASGHIGEYTFWIANRARFGRPEAIGSENFDLLLGLDLHARTACLTIGYGLEPYLTELDLERALAAASGPFHEGAIAEGVRRCVEVVIDRMRELVKRSESAPPPDISTAAASFLAISTAAGPRPVPMGVKLAIILGALGMVLAAARISIRAWNSFNLFDRQYRLPPAPPVQPRLGASRSGGRMATIVFR